MGTDREARLRDCSCLGFCRGRDGLSDRYVCALEQRQGKVRSTPPEATPEPPTPEPCEGTCNPHRARCGATFCTYEDCVAHERECKAPTPEPQRCVCPSCEPLVEPVAPPTQDPIDRLEKAAWDYDVAMALVWYRDQITMLMKRRLRETERALTLETKRQVRAEAPTPESERPAERCVFRMRVLNQMWYGRQVRQWYSTCGATWTPVEDVFDPRTRSRCPKCDKPLSVEEDTHAS